MGRQIKSRLWTGALTALLFGLISAPVPASAHTHVSAMCSDVHAAAYLGEPEELAQLIARGADLNCLDSLNQTPLITATDGASVKIVEMLLAHGVKPNLRDEVGETALTKARLKEIFFQVQGGERYQAIYRRIIMMLEDSGAVEYAGKGAQVPGVTPAPP
ncbi:MAG: ankyrin repeat domain-containing protein [Alphaproteobacteria bacterium]